MKAIGAALALVLMPAAALAAGEGQPLSSTVDPTAALPKTAPLSQPLQTPGPNRAAPASSPEDLQPRFVLTDVKFDGAKAVSEATLAPAWTEFRGRPVTLVDLRTIARRAEAIYSAAGYPFVAIVVTPQAVEGGVVRLRVVEGRITNLTVLSKDPNARRQATAAFAPLVDKQPLSLDAVESAYENAKTVPGLVLGGALRRGSEPGGMDLVVQAKRQAWQAYANVNNYYPSTTGPFGALIGVDHFGDSAWGDQTSLQLYSSLENGRQTVVRFSHLQRLNASGTTISGMVLGAWASPKGAVAPLDIATNVGDVRLAITQPIFNQSHFSLTGEGAFEVDNQKTKVFTSVGLSDDRLRIFSALLTGVWTPTAGGHVNASAELRKGVRVFDASRQGDASLSRFGADPEAFVLRGKVDAESPTFWHVRLWTRVDAQTTDHALTAPEQYAIGNLSIGRGYEPGSAFGDRALAFSGEVRGGPFPIGGAKLQLEPFMFYDAARLWTLTPGQHTRRDISSWGGGVRLEVPGKFRFELMYAAPQKPPLGLGEPTPHSRVLVNVTLGLNSVISALSGPQSKEGGK